MNKYSIAVTLVCMAIALILGACALPQATAAPTPIPTPETGQIANPAAAYCVEKGYLSEIRTATDGSQYGVCIFPDGTECEEWAFFRGQCGPGAKPTETPLARQRVFIPEIGLTCEIPPDWQRQGQEWVWAPSADSKARLGIVWGDVQLGQERESILPDNAVMLNRTEGPQFPWGTAATYKLQVMVPGGQGQVQAVETHVVVVHVQKLCDFYASAGSDKELAVLEGALQGLLASVTWSAQ